MKAWNEWLPVSGKPWSSFEIGDLATIFRPETRLTARSERLDPVAIIGTSGDPVAKLKALRDGPLADPKRTLMGPEQEQWLQDGIARSKQRGAKWQILAQQVVMPGRCGCPSCRPHLSPASRIATRAGCVPQRALGRSGKAGTAPDFDSWDGFPRSARAPARRRPGCRCGPGRAVGRQP